MNCSIALLLATSLLGAAPDAGVWHGDYAAALDAARADRKPLLVVFHNPQEAQQTVQQVNYAPEKESPHLENYHLCQIDVSSANGKRVAEVFKATSFPYTVITDRDAQKIILRKPGNFTDATWTETLSNYRHGSTPVSMSVFGAPSSATSGYCPNCQN